MRIEREVEISLDLIDLKDKLFKTTFTAAGIDYTVVKIIEEKQAVLLFTPKKGFSAYYNSFAPTAKVYYDGKKMNIFCSLDKRVKVFKTVFYAFCVIFMLSGLATLTIGESVPPELYLLPVGLGAFMYFLSKIVLYLSSRSFLKSLYEELGI